MDASIFFENVFDVFLKTSDPPDTELTYYWDRTWKLVKVNTLYIVHISILGSMQVK